MSDQFLEIYGAKENNLKNVDVKIPLHKFVSVLGVSGSGKTSLFSDIIGQEGSRLLLENIPELQEKFLLKNKRPKFDKIINLPATVKLEQTNKSKYANSTLSSISELSDYLRVFYSRFADNPQILSKSYFSFRTKLGACPSCNGIGSNEFISIDKLIIDPNKSLREGVLAPTLPDGYIMYSQVTLDVLNTVCKTHNFSIDTPWNQLTKDQQNVILYGSDRIKVPFGKHSIESRLKWTGIKAKPREEGFYKGMISIMSDILRRDRNKNILKYVDSKTCEDCKGSKLNKEALDVKWNNKNIHELSSLSLEEIHELFTQSNINNDITKTIIDKLDLLIQFDFGNYSLLQSANDLSSGDIQRIELLNLLQLKLSNILIILDEPSIGLSQSQSSLLYQKVQELVNAGNSVILIEHDLNCINYSDWIIEVGPKAGEFGGEIVFNGSKEEFIRDTTSTVTKDCFYEYNNINTSVKTTKLSITNYPNIPYYKRTDIIKQIENPNIITDNSIGNNIRSNISTYTGLSDLIRDAFSKTDNAKEYNLKKSHFSFNHKDGRCEKCEGAGIIKIGLGYIGDLINTCDQCNGKRFNERVRKVKLHNKSITEVYDLTIRQALEFFKSNKKTFQILSTLNQLGLGYLKIGQNSSSLSGGEAQRIRLAKYLLKSTKKSNIVIHDPSIGLHYSDVKKLIDTFNKLSQQVNSIITFENHVLFGNIAPNKSFPTNKKKTASDFLLEIKGVETNYLKNLDLTFNRDEITVITGISGSGKSSLLKGTIYAESKSRLLQCLSPYQRSQIKHNNTAKFNTITNLSPCVFISHKNITNSQRSTLGTLTGLNSKLRYLFSRHAQNLGLNISANDLSFNSKNGMCPDCIGIGEKLLPDFNKIILNPNLSIEEGLLTHNTALNYYGNPDSQFVAIAKEAGIPINIPYAELSKDQQNLLLFGSAETIYKTTWHYKSKKRTGKQQIEMKWEGIYNLLNKEFIQKSGNKNIQKLKDLFHLSNCDSCNGSRLNKQALSIYINECNLSYLTKLSVYELRNWFESHLNNELISFIYNSCQSTFELLIKLELGHLSLDRKSSTLSGGESQRVELVNYLDSSLTGITYILDEPSIGLDSSNIEILKSLISALKNKGNQIIISEHRKEMISMADRVIEIGPNRGKHGGEIVFDGSFTEYIDWSSSHPLFKNQSTNTNKQTKSNSLHVNSFKKHNINFDSSSISIGELNVITGKSGSGKSTYLKHLDGILNTTEGKTIFIEQNQIRRSSNQYLGDYLDLFDSIFQVFSKNTNHTKSSFNFRNKNNQCHACKGSGLHKIYLDIESDISENCNTCKGKRYSDEILEQTVKGNSVYDILKKPIEDVLIWCKDLSFNSDLLKKCDNFISYNIGHLTPLSSTNLISSGELNRLKLIESLQSNDTQFILMDEPSICLSYSDIDDLYNCFQSIIDRDITIIIAEHNEYLISKCSNRINLISH